MRQALSHYIRLRMKKLIYFLAFFHLSVIAVVIFHGLDSVVHKGWWEKPLAFICNINYSIWQYGFSLLM